MCPGILPATGWMAQVTFAPSAFEPVGYLAQRVPGLRQPSATRGISIGSPPVGAGLVILLYE